MRFSARLSAALAACFLAGASFADRSFDLARQALRDGLWDVARNEARKSESGAAALVVLETYAKERRWDDLESEARKAAPGAGDGAVYFEAMAQAMKGEGESALKTLDGIAAGSGSPFASRVPLLKAFIALDAGNAALAKKISGENGLENGDVDSRLVAAFALKASGDQAKADEILRGVIRDGNAGEDRIATAAISLDSPEEYRKAIGQTISPGVRRTLSLALGRKLLATKDGLEEGAKTIKQVVLDSPGADGAMETFLALADAYLEAGSWENALESFKQAMEAWPEASKSPSVQEGIGWACRKLGRTEEALEAFGKAGEFASGDATRAKALMEQGDILAENGRGAESLAKYKTVLELYPDTPAGVKLKSVVEMKEMESDGRTLFGNFKFREAAVVFAEVAKRDPSRRESMEYMTMLCLYGQGMDSEALRKAKDLAAGAVDPSIKAEATLWLAKFFYNARQWRDSCDLFEEYAKKLAPGSPRSPSSLVWAARAAFAGNEFQRAVDIVTVLMRGNPPAAERSAGFLIQGEALVELSRLDEAAVIFETVVSDPAAGAADRRRARMLRADSLFILGADNPQRYREALDEYRSLQMGESLDADMKLSLSFKIARTLEKLGKKDDAIERYYCDVVLAYRDGRARGVSYSDESKATFTRAAFLVADEFEARGDALQSEKILRLVVKSDVAPAVKEAKARRDRLKGKGMLQ